MLFYGYGDKKVETEYSNRKKRDSVFFCTGFFCFLVCFWCFSFAL